jgi:hypothetical protein
MKAAQESMVHSITGQQAEKGGMVSGNGPQLVSIGSLLRDALEFDSLFLEKYLWPLKWAQACPMHHSTGCK